MEERLARIEMLTLLSAKQMLNVKDLSLLTGFKESYIRRLVEENKLPYYKPLGKMIFFDKDEIVSLLKTNRVPSVMEIASRYPLL